MSFSYRPLISGAQQIRLIRLYPMQRTTCATNDTQPGTNSTEHDTGGDDRIQCSIFHDDLTDAPEYTALSYTWGSQIERRSIVIDGAIVEIGVNLELALRHLRDHNDMETLVLWVDAICIDQQSEIEKTEQVQQMRDIYHRAKLVIAWLGPASDESTVAMEWIQAFGTRSLELNIGATPDLQLPQLLCQDNIEEPSLRQFLEDLHEALMPSPKGHTEMFVRLRKFFHRPYWRRRWIAQEVAMAAELSFRCGNYVVSEEQLYHAFRLFRSYLNHGILTYSKDFKVRFVTAKYVVTLFKLRQMKTRLPLAYLLRMFGKGACSDPRDVIFSLLGICSDVDDLGIVVDYTKTYEQVHTEVARAMAAAGMFDFRSYGARVEGTNLPSWVPGWREDRRALYLQQQAVQTGTANVAVELQPKFSASGNLVQPTVALFSEAKPWNAPLVVSMVRIGRIVRRGTAWKPGQEAKWLTELRQFAIDACSNNTDLEAACRVAWRTAVADQNIRQGRDKPRLLKEQIDMICAKLREADLDSISEKALADMGLGDFAIQLRSIASRRRPIQLESGAIGIAGTHAAIGDEIIVILGATVPVVLREQDLNTDSKLMGEAYVHGFMDGEGMIDPVVQQVFLA